MKRVRKACWGTEKSRSPGVRSPRERNANIGAVLLGVAALAFGLLISYTTSSAKFGLISIILIGSSGVMALAIYSQRGAGSMRSWTTAIIGVFAVTLVLVVAVLLK